MLISIISCNIPSAFSGRKKRLFSAGSGQGEAAVNTRRVWLRCTRCLYADGQVGGGAVAEFSGGGSGEVVVGDGSPVPSGRNFSRSGGRVPYSQPYGCRAFQSGEAFGWSEAEAGDHIGSPLLRWRLVCSRPERNGQDRSLRLKQ